MVTIQSQVDISIVQMKKWSFEKTKSSVQGHMGRKWQNENIQTHMRLAPMQNPSLGFMSVCKAWVL